MNPLRWNTFWFGVPVFAGLALLGYGWANLLWASSCAGLAWLTERTPQRIR